MPEIWERPEVWQQYQQLAQSRASGQLPWYAGATTASGLGGLAPLEESPKAAWEGKKLAEDRVRRYRNSVDKFLSKRPDVRNDRQAMSQIMAQMSGDEQRILSGNRVLPADLTLGYAEQDDPVLKLTRARELAKQDAYYRPGDEARIQLNQRGELDRSAYEGEVDKRRGERDKLFESFDKRYEAQEGLLKDELEAGLRSKASYSSQLRSLEDRRNGLIARLYGPSGEYADLAQQVEEPPPQEAEAPVAPLVEEAAAIAPVRTTDGRAARRVSPRSGDIITLEDGTRVRRRQSSAQFARRPASPSAALSKLRAAKSPSAEVTRESLSPEAQQLAEVLSPEQKPTIDVPVTISERMGRGARELAAGVAEGFLGAPVEFGKTSATLLEGAQEVAKAGVRGAKKGAEIGLEAATKVADVAGRGIDVVGQTIQGGADAVDSFLRGLTGDTQSAGKALGDLIRKTPKKDAPEALAAFARGLGMTDEKRIAEQVKEITDKFSPLFLDGDLLGVEARQESRESRAGQVPAGHVQYARDGESGYIPAVVARAALKQPDTEKELLDKYWKPLQEK